MRKYLKVLFIFCTSRLIIFVICSLTKYLQEYDLSTYLINKNEYINNLIRWDSVFFTKISHNGYTQIHQTVFLPLLPYLVRFISKVFRINHEIIAIIISNLCFLLSNILLFKITEELFTPEFADIVIIFFNFYPTSILNSTFYTESIYTLFFLIIIIFSMNKYNIYLKELFNIIIFNLMAITRSNTIHLSFVYNVVFQKNFNSVIFLPLKLVLQNLSFIIFQYHLQKKFKDDYINYFGIQKKYWNQGFLKFYQETKNLPNFFVGFPFIVFYISQFDLIYFIKEFYYIVGIYNSRLRSKKQKIRLYLLISFYSHMFMQIFLFHLQTFMRFVSINPVCVWILSSYFVNNYNNQVKYRKIICRFIMFFYFNFFIIYTVLYSLYYPPC